MDFKINVTLDFAKETLNTVQYRTDAGVGVDALYVKKFALPIPYPERLVVSVRLPQ